MRVEVSVQFEVGVIQAEVDEGPDRLRCEVGRDEARVLLEGREGSPRGSSHVAGGVEGLDVEGSVVGVVG